MSAINRQQVDVNNPNAVTNASVIAAIGYTPENVANKATDFTVLNDTKYPSTAATDARINAAITSGKSFRGGYDASVNTFPATGGSGTAGAIKAGDNWFITVSGTLGGELVTVGDAVLALVDTPGQTASNWGITHSTVTAGVIAKTGAYTVTVADNLATFTNEGTAASVPFSLPSAVKDLQYSFYVQDADGLSVIAAAGDTIRLSASVSAAAGNASSTNVGSGITLTAINSTEWVAVNGISGVWLVT